MKRKWKQISHETDNRCSYQEVSKKTTGVFSESGEFDSLKVGDYSQLLPSNRSVVASIPKKSLFPPKTNYLFTPHFCSQKKPKKKKHATKKNMRSPTEPAPAPAPAPALALALS